MFKKRQSLIRPVWFHAVGQENCMIVFFFSASVTSVKLSLEYQLFSDYYPQYSDNNEEFARPESPPKHLHSRKRDTRHQKAITKLCINEFQQYPFPHPRGRTLVLTGQFTSCEIMGLSWWEVLPAKTRFCYIPDADSHKWEQYSKISTRLRRRCYASFSSDSSLGSMLTSETNEEIYMKAFPSCF